MERLRRMDIKFLRGMGPKRAELLEKNLGIKTYYDLLYHFPTHYIDRTSMYRIRDFAGDDMPSVQVKGKFVSFNLQGEGAKTRLVGLFSDGSAVMEVVWFQRIKAIRQAYHTATEYIVFGKPACFNGRWSMVHPEVDVPGSTYAVNGFRGVYPLTEQLRSKGFSSRTFSAAVSDILGGIRTLTETLPAEIIARYRLMGIREALYAIHNPQSNEQLRGARLRLKFEELFYLQLNIQRYARRR
ncbi:MAG: ATP-dependent DNA helicase RecG, partial [Duncaniella sp.]|nr:ATP-dependent DNA helicase RecG [Duncaniella sp.]